MTEKLYDEPEHQDSKQNPLSEGLKAVERNYAETVQAKHSKLSAFEPNTFYKKLFSDSVCDGASQEPYP